LTSHLPKGGGSNPQIGFFKIYGVSAQTRGEGVNFSWFCLGVFYGRPLMY